MKFNFVSNNKANLVIYSCFYKNVFLYIGNNAKSIFTYFAKNQLWFLACKTFPNKRIFKNVSKVLFPYITNRKITGTGLKFRWHMEKIICIDSNSRKFSQLLKISSSRYIIKMQKKNEDKSKISLELNLTWKRYILPKKKLSNFRLPIRFCFYIFCQGFQY